mgnify:CR=1 FL=1
MASTSSRRASSCRRALKVYPIQDNGAIEIGHPYVLCGQAGRAGPPRPETGQFTHCWKQENGQWKLVPRPELRPRSSRSDGDSLLADCPVAGLADTSARHAADLLWQPPCLAAAAAASEVDDAAAQVRSHAVADGTCRRFSMAVLDDRRLAGSRLRRGLAHRRVGRIRRAGRALARLRRIRCRQSLLRRALLGLEARSRSSPRC